MSGELREQVIAALRGSRRPQSTARIARSCGVRSTLGVATVLRALQEDGLVAAQASGFWQWIGPLEARAPAGQLAATKPARAARPAEEAPAVHGASGRWSTFRRLCRYYADCVRLEERSKVEVSAASELAEFMPLARGVDWAGLSAGRPAKLVLNDEEMVFVRKGLSRSRYPRWFLGGPVDVFRVEDRDTGEIRNLLRPIFHMQVVVELEDHELTLLPTGIVEVNHGWLQKRFRRAEHRQEFLAAVGLDEAESRPFDDEVDSDALLRIVDIRAAWRALAVGYRSWWKEFPQVDRLETTPPLGALQQSGVYNRALLIVGPRLQYARRLVDELLELADVRADGELDQTALAALFPHEPGSSVGIAASGEADGADSEASPPSAEYQLLNPEQRAGVQSGLARDLTVLTGPPGTGKSVVVGHTMLNMALAGRSTLFASRNHQAIEAVEPKLNALVEPDLLVMRPARPFGQNAIQQEWQQALVMLLSKPRPPGAQATHAAARDRLEAALGDRKGLEDQIAALHGLREDLAAVEIELGPIEEAIGPERARLARSASWAGSSEAELSGQMERLAATRQRLEAPGFAARCLRLWYALLRLCGRDPLVPLAAAAKALLARLGDASAGAADLASLGAALADWRQTIVARGLVERAQSIRERVEALPSLEELTAALVRAQQRVQVATVDAAAALAAAAGAGVSAEQREAFAELRAGLENHRGAWSEDRFHRAFGKVLPKLLEHFPLWAVSNLSAHKAAPLQPAAFDLLIVDEASQCDIASVVPLLFRARRAMVVGDPMQLQQICSLPQPTDLRLRMQSGLAGPEARLERYSYRTNSFFDLASSSVRAESRGLLAHYRCHPDIAAFCNAQFYGGQLRVMTDRQRLVQVPGVAGSVRGCEWTDVRGPIEAAPKGCYSPSLTEAVLAELQKLAGLGFEGTVGVVTPFRVQADRMRDRLHATLGPDVIGRWHLLVNTVDAFQGDERDLILFALVAGPDMPEGSAGFLRSAPNRFNVAVSRARSFLRVLGHRSWAATCGVPFIEHLVRACTEAERRTRAPARMDLVGPVWEPRLAEALRSAGIRFEQQYPACGYYLDFAVFVGDRRIDIEVDGETYHRSATGERNEADIHRDFVLSAAGWTVLRFWVYELRESLDGCVNRVRNAVGAP